MKFILLFAMALAAFAAPASAQIYRWADKDGKVHYTQTPPPPEAKNVQKKAFGGGVVAPSNLPYATQIAAKNFPVTLYTSPDCGAACELARSMLVKRTIPFKEISVFDQKTIDEVKKISGKNGVPVMVVGAQAQSGFHEDAYKNALDFAGYPSSGPQLPLEALRKVDPVAKPAEAAPPEANAQAQPGAASAPDAAAR